jgi:hypothetical protein
LARNWAAVIAQSNDLTAIRACDLRAHRGDLTSLRHLAVASVSAFLVANEVAKVKIANDTFFDPETITLLRRALDDAWSRLPPGQTKISRSVLAERILKLASQGEHDPVRLRARAIIESIEGGM